MALTFIDVKGGQSNTGGTSFTLPAFTSSPVAGDVIHVLYSTYDGINVAHLSVTDNKSNTYTQVGTIQLFNAFIGLTVWRTTVVTGGASFTITLNGDATHTAYTGIASLIRGSSGYNSDTVGQQTTSANPSSGTSSPAPSGSSIFFGAMTNGSTNAVTNGSGWNDTTLGNGYTAAMNLTMRQTDNSSFQDGYVEYRIASVATAAVWTEASDIYAARVMSFLDGSIVPEAPTIYTRMVMTQRMG